MNAYATLGGHIVIYEGLWNLLESENAAAMLLGHEIAHLKNRDPIRSASGGVVAALAIGLLFDEAGLLDDFFGVSSLLTQLHFSREQETEADSSAAAAMIRLYGHLAGATDLFDELGKGGAGLSRPPEFLSTHPHLEERVIALRQLADRNGWTFEGVKLPRP